MGSHFIEYPALETVDVKVGVKQPAPGLPSGFSLRTDMSVSNPAEGESYLTYSHGPVEAVGVGIEGAANGNLSFDTKTGVVKTDIFSHGKAGVAVGGSYNFKTGEIDARVSVGVSRLNGYVEIPIDPVLRNEIAVEMWKAEVTNSAIERALDYVSGILHGGDGDGEGGIGPSYDDTTIEVLGDILSDAGSDWNPFAEYHEAMVAGDTPAAATAAMEFPGVYDDAILRVAAGVSLHGQQVDDDGGHNPGDDPHDPRGNDQRGGTNGDTGGTSTGTTTSNSTITGTTSISTTLSGSSGNYDPYHSEEHYENIGNGTTITGLPIILDLDGDGVQVTELSQSNQFIDVDNTGLQNRIAWAAAGNGVLFYDPEGYGEIRETRQFVFTEWDPTAGSDIEAMALVFDTNGDGELTGAELDDFYVLETMDDGSAVVRTMADLGITSISVEPDATNITLPDGSVITGQATYEFVDANGDTQERTLADVTLQAEAMGYRVEHAESVDGAGTRTQITTGYGLDGSVAFVHEFERSAGRLKVENRYDDNGDGVVDRLQVVTSVAVTGGEAETVSNYQDGDTATAILLNLTVTTTIGDTVTIERDSPDGGWSDQREVQLTDPNDYSLTIITKDRAEDSIREFDWHPIAAADIHLFRPTPIAQRMAQ